MKPYLWVLAAFVFISSFLLVPDVYAQFGGGGGMGGGMGGGGRPPGDRGKGCDTVERANVDKGPMGNQPPPMSREQLQYQLQTLQTDLRLAPEQATLWQPFAERVLALESDLTRQRVRSISASDMEQKGQAADSIKQVARAVDTARNHLTALEDIEASSRALYQTLEPGQKTMANARLGALLAPLLRG